MPQHLARSGVAKLQPTLPCRKLMEMPHREAFNARLILIRTLLLSPLENPDILIGDLTR